MTRRPPPGTPPPRYWFVHASPFQQIDISFHTPAEYQTLISQPTYLGHPVTSREVFTRTTAAAPVTLPAPSCPLVISEDEQAIGACIYLLLRAIKLCARGAWERSVVEERHAALHALAGAMDRATLMGGGAIGELTHRVLALARPWLPLPITAVGERW